MMFMRTDKKPPQAVDFSFENFKYLDENNKPDVVGAEFYYFRKHPNLHGWIRNLYIEKGGSQNENDFWGPVELTMEDFEKLEVDIKNKKLPNTVGFFFGFSADYSDEDSMKVVTQAKKLIEEGKHVFYYSSW